MRKGEHPDPAADAAEATGCCPFQEAIDLLSKRHAMTIIWLLQQQEPRRFNEIKRELAINPVSLSQRLTELEEGGILERKTFRETPPRVEYRLTPKGRDLLPLMDQLGRWARKHDIHAERPERLVHA
jgi:DNA-binding HxlR family transcriptional regulator